MLDQLIADYLAALRRREEARRQFDATAEVLAAASRVMAETRQQLGANPRVYHPGAAGTGPVADPRRWPTADAVNRASQDLVAASVGAQAAWDVLPADKRLGLHPPETAK